MNAVLSRRMAYAALREWYQANESKLLEKGGDPEGEYTRSSIALIRALPKSESVSEAEISAVFHHVLTMYLEWAYIESDGVMAMHEYAQIGAKKSSSQLTDAEKDELKQSRLFPYLGL